MSITGTGISTDPYIVDTYHDLVTVGAYDQSNMYVELNPNTPNKVMDISTDDRYAFGVANIIPSANMASINGNGWIIMNGRAEAGNLFQFHSGGALTVTNLKLYNHLIHLIYQYSSGNTETLNTRFCGISVIYRDAPEIASGSYSAFIHMSILSVDCSWYLRCTKHINMTAVNVLCYFRQGSERNNIELNAKISRTGGSTNCNIIRGTTHSSVYGTVSFNITKAGIVGVETFYLNTCSGSIASLNYIRSGPSNYTVNVYRTLSTVGTDVDTLLVNDRELGENMVIDTTRGGLISSEDAKSQDALIDLGFLL